jgi:hypothetical protein
VRHSGRTRAPSDQQLSEVPAEGVPHQSRGGRPEVIEQRFDVTGEQFCGQGQRAGAGEAVTAEVEQDHAEPSSEQCSVLAGEHAVVRSGSVQEHDRSGRAPGVGVAHLAARDHEDLIEIRHLLNLDRSPRPGHPLHPARQPF